MSSFHHSYISRKILCIDGSKFKNIGDLKEFLSSQEGIDNESSFLVCNGVLVSDTEPVKKDVVYHTYLRMLGGKGGFGSMLRAIGAQIEKTTNREACRDLSGRRLRDVNNEKDLKEWLGKQAEREHERAKRHEEYIARRRAMPNHKFEDQLYQDQKRLLTENQEDALQQGLKKVCPKLAASATVTSEEALGRKRKSESQDPGISGTSKKKKGVEWLGVDVDSLSDLDIDEDTPKSGGSEQREASSYIEAIQEVVGSGGSDESNFSEDWMKSISDQKNTLDQTIYPNAEDKGHQGSCVSTIKQENDATAIVPEHIATDSQFVEEQDKPFILENFVSVEELEHLGLERLKQELMNRGLKCGGTLQQRAERLFSVKGLSKEEIDPNLFAKSDGKKVKSKH